MTLVADTGPLIALAKIRRLFLLRDLGWQTVLIPQRVHRELLGKLGPEADEIDRALAAFVRAVTVPPPQEPLRSAVSSLDEGEREVLTLAASLSEPVPVLLDDSEARAAAKRLGLAVTGTVGVLLLAKKRGAVDHVLPLLYEARAHGYWLSDALITVATKLAGE